MIEWEMACWRNDRHMQDYCCCDRMGDGLFGAMIGACRTTAAVIEWEVACWRNGRHMQDYCLLHPPRNSHPVCPDHNVQSTLAQHAANTAGQVTNRQFLPCLWQGWPPQPTPLDHQALYCASVRRRQGGGRRSPAPAAAPPAAALQRQCRLLMYQMWGPAHYLSSCHKTAACCASCDAVDSRPRAGHHHVHEHLQKECCAMKHKHRLWCRCLRRGNDVDTARTCIELGGQHRLEVVDQLHLLGGRTDSSCLSAPFVSAAHPADKCCWSRSPDIQRGVLSSAQRTASGTAKRYCAAVFNS